jgi:cystathionine beta-lyase/cystathionine gamma-synthase
VATPALLRPIEHEADIVVHSLTKSATAGGFAVAGGLISRKNIVSNVSNEEMKADFASYVKFWPYRDNGPALAPMNAIFTINDLRTLRLRMDRVSQNTMKVAQFLEGHPKVSQCDYLGLPSHPLHDLAKRYMILVDSEDDHGEPVNRYGHLMSFRVKGSAQDTRNVFDRMERIFRATDLGRIKSVATIPAISTHQQQGEEAREMADIPEQLIRLCVGAEHPDDVIADLDQALSVVP